MPLPADDDIRHALALVSRAIERTESTAAEAYSTAALNAQLTSYGHFCAKRALLQRIKADLQLLARTVHTASVLAVEE